MNREEKERLSEDFDLWLKTKFTDVLWVKGHKFEKTEGDGILVDNGFFTKEEAKSLFEMLTSRNTFTRFNATLLVWERNDRLIEIIVILALIALILIYIKVRR